MKRNYFGDILDELTEEIYESELAELFATPRPTKRERDLALRRAIYEEEFFDQYAEIL